MKAHIDVNGNLHLERSGEMKKQRCPYNSNLCGDWCPLFLVQNALTTDSAMVSLCHNREYYVDLAEELP